MKNTIKFPLHKNTVHMITVKCEIAEIIVALSNRSEKKRNGKQKAQQALLFEGLRFSPSRVD